VLAVLAAVGIAGIGHVAQSDPVRTWQERQAGRLECTVVITAGREDLLEGFC
jgi:hypothetical protein